MKKFLSIFLVTLMLLATISTAAFAGDAKQLQFNSDGKFRIVHLTDIQDGYPMVETTKVYINEMLKTLKPDLVVLGGDNTVAGLEGDDNYTVIEGEKVCYDDLSDEQFALVEDEYIEKVKKVKESAIKEIADIFVENQTYFTLVFGNHDHQQFGRNSEINCEKNKEYLLSLYQKFGGEYCLAYDADKSLFGVGTHNLTVLSSDGSKVAYNLYIMDSNTYYEDKGYDAVHPDQIAWYEGVSASLKEANGGTAVPAMMFQHIIVQEAYDSLFIASPFSWGDIGEDFEGVEKEGVYHFSYLPKVANIKDGYLFEKCCPGYYNYGQFSSLVKTGDVKAIFSGHDHTNNFTITIDGIDVINTGGCTYNSYGSDLNRGVRVIDLDEKDTSTYSTYTYTVAEAALVDGSDITNHGDITKTEAGFALFGIKFMDALVAVLRVIFFLVK